MRVGTEPSAVNCFSTLDKRPLLSFESRIMSKTMERSGALAEVGGL
jgi:hypothetical protein